MVKGGPIKLLVNRTDQTAIGLKGRYSGVIVRLKIQAAIGIKRRYLGRVVRFMVQTLVVGYMGRMVDDCYILISSSEVFSDAFILPYYPP